MLFATPKEHAANPPSSWIVRKRSARRWGGYGIIAPDLRTE
jgi:hypothetical protein